MEIGKNPYSFDDEDIFLKHLQMHSQKQQISNQLDDELAQLEKEFKQEIQLDKLTKLKNDGRGEEPKSKKISFAQDFKNNKDYDDNNGEGLQQIDAQSKKKIQYSKKEFDLEESLFAKQLELENHKQYSFNQSIYEHHDQILGQGLFLKGIHDKEFQLYEQQKNKKRKRQEDLLTFQNLQDQPNDQNSQSSVVKFLKTENDIQDDNIEEVKEVRFDQEQSIPILNFNKQPKSILKKKSCLKGSSFTKIDQENTFIINFDAVEEQKKFIFSRVHFEDNEQTAVNNISPVLDYVQIHNNIDPFIKMAPSDKLFSVTTIKDMAWYQEKYNQISNDVNDESSSDSFEIFQPNDGDFTKPIQVKMEEKQEHQQQQFSKKEEPNIKNQSNEYESYVKQIVLALMPTKKEDQSSKNAIKSQKSNKDKIHKRKYNYDFKDYTNLFYKFDEDDLSACLEISVNNSEDEQQQKPTNKKKKIKIQEKEEAQIKQLQAQIDSTNQQNQTLSQEDNINDLLVDNKTNDKPSPQQQNDQIDGDQQQNQADINVKEEHFQNIENIIQQENQQQIEEMNQAKKRMEQLEIFTPIENCKIHIPPLQQMAFNMNSLQKSIINPVNTFKKKIFKHVIKNLVKDKKDIKPDEEYLTFHIINQCIPLLLKEQNTDNITLQCSFLSLLFLANEKQLYFEGNESDTNFYIFKDTQENKQQLL